MAPLLSILAPEIAMKGASVTAKLRGVTGDAPVKFWPSMMFRPPMLAPRRRGLDPRVESRLCRWLRHALRVPALTTIELSEWVSVDSRALPHRLYVTVRAAGAWQHFVIDKASERIVEADVPGILLPSPYDLDVDTQPIFAIEGPVAQRRGAPRAGSLPAPDKL